MMATETDRKLFRDYIRLLRAELQVALGCTEPVAIAYAAAYARSLIPEGEIEKIDLSLSGNIVKNAFSVTVPNAGGKCGIKVAALLGAIGGKAEAELACLSEIDDEDRALCEQYLREKRCRIHCLCDVPGLRIIVELQAAGHTALVEIRDSHTNIVRVELDGEAVCDPATGKPRFVEVLRQDAEASPEDIEQVIEASCEGAVILQDEEDGNRPVDKLKLRERLELKEIIRFSEETELDELRELLERQIELNTAIAREGLEHSYGAEIGQTLKDTGRWEDVELRVKALTAAASDARMSGCSLPVVINSGSGNQGITVSVPVIIYAEEIGASRDELLRALICSNLIALLQKRYIGNLSAYCGVMCAATGAVCGITFLQGGRYKEIGEVITNTLGNISGVFCDGAKASCAAKIASGLEAGFLGMHMMKRSCTFRDGDGLTKASPEETIRGIGYVAREGMRSTDREILKVMLDEAGDGD